MSMLPRNILKKMKAYSPFYQAVWAACAEIPKGEVRSYGWIAKRIGRPGAARAVGRALGANPFAPIVPCHRVIRSDGTLGGFSAPGGLRTKKRLLQNERQNW
ncbi:MAG: MGMT family protein [Elusimicrobia bacterium]|nr:MGMT family protein [Elusimicrobiota bacterium]